MNSCDINAHYFASSPQSLCFRASQVSMDHGYTWIVVEPPAMALLTPTATIISHITITDIITALIIILLYPLLLLISLVVIFPSLFCLLSLCCVVHSVKHDICCTSVHPGRGIPPLLLSIRFLPLFCFRGVGAFTPFPVRMRGSWDRGCCMCTDCKFVIDKMNLIEKFGDDYW